MNFNKIETQTRYDNFPFVLEENQNNDLDSNSASSDEKDVSKSTRPYQKWKNASLEAQFKPNSHVRPILNANLNHSPPVSNPANDPSSTLLGRIKEGFKDVAYKVFYVIKFIVAIAKLILLPPLKIIASLLIKIGKTIVKAGKGISKSVGGLLKGAAKCVAAVGKILGSAVMAVGKHPKVALLVVGVVATIAAIPTIIKVGTAVGNVFATVFNVVMFVPNLLMGK